MNPRVLIVIALALVCGVSSMFLVKALRNPPPSAPAVERTAVVFAKAEAPAGQLLTEADLEVRQVPDEELPEDAIRKVADALDRATRVPLDKGDMLRDRKLAARGAGQGMAALIPPGMRAYNVATPTASASLAGSLRPRDKVDVLLTTAAAGPAAGEPARATTSALLQNVEVLEVHGPPAPPSASGPAPSAKAGPAEIQSVTLLVSPASALELDSGRNRGTLQLTLRNPVDKDVQVTRPAVAVAPPPPPKPRPLKPGGIATIELARTLRGTQAGRSTLKVRVPDHETLVGYTVMTPHGAYRLDDSITVEPDPSKGIQPIATPFDDAKAQLASAPGPARAPPADPPAVGPALLRRLVGGLGPR